MLVFKENNKNSCFVHIPKNSGTWVNYEIEKKYQIVKKFWFNDPQTNREYGYTEGFLDRAHIPINIFEKFFFKDDIEKYYCLTRNPYQRLISAWLFRTKRFKSSRHTYETYFSFKNFVKNRLNRNDPNLPIFRRYGFGVHYLTQNSFLQSDNKDKISIYKVEEPMSIPLLSDKLKFKVKFYPLHLFYDEESIEIVNKKYIKDFVQFGYNMIT